MPVIPYIILAVFAGITAYLAFRFVSIARRERREATDKMESDPEMPKFVEFKVRVIDKKCGVATTGTKIPQVGKKFIVTFMTEQGQTMEYEILEQSYLEMGNAKSGTLLTVNGNFYGFCPDEE